MKYPKSGRFNLKGKKTKRLGCNCCEIINFKEEKLKKIALKELKEEIESVRRNGYGTVCKT